MLEPHHLIIRSSYTDWWPETHTFCKMEKGSILYVGRKKPKQCPKGCRGKDVRVLYCTTGGSTDGAHNVMLLRQREEEWNPTKSRTWYYNNISGCFKEKAGGEAGEARYLGTHQI